MSYEAESDIKGFPSHKLDDEIARFNKFQGHVIQVVGATKIATADLDVRAYAKYVLRDGSVSEKRELLGNLRSRLVYQNKHVTLLENDGVSSGV